jgi:NAD(P)-dependent dehydrogenase (short-subunit alcohol dehydrogenase family)
MMGRRRVALVTGAGSGAGREICLALAVAEFRVVGADLNPIAAEMTAAKLRTANADVLALGVDVTDPTSAETMAQRAIDYFGRVDVFVNCQVWAVYRTDGRMNDEDVSRGRVRLLAGIQVGCAVIRPFMRERREGCIVNVVSSPVPAFRQTVVDNACERARSDEFVQRDLAAQTRLLARTLAHDRIRVNSVIHDADEIESCTSRPDSAEPGDPPCPATLAALFLVSDRAKYLTGWLLRAHADSHLARCAA